MPKNNVCHAILQMLENALCFLHFTLQNEKNVIVTPFCTCGKKCFFHFFLFFLFFSHLEIVKNRLFFLHCALQHAKNMFFHTISECWKKDVFPRISEIAENDIFCILHCKMQTKTTHFPQFPNARKKLFFPHLQNGVILFFCVLQCKNAKNRERFPAFAEWRDKRCFLAFYIVKCTNKRFSTISKCQKKSVFPACAACLFFVFSFFCFVESGDFPGKAV